MSKAKVNPYNQFKNIKTRVIAQTGGLTNEQIKHYYKQITIFNSDADQNMKLDLRKKEVWLVIEKYTTRIKFLHKQATEPKQQPLNWKENVKNQYQHLSNPTGRGVAERATKEIEKTFEKI